MTSQPDTVTDSVMLSHTTRIAKVVNAVAEADAQIAGQMGQLGGGALVDLGALTAELRSCPRTCFRI